MNLPDPKPRQKMSEDAKKVFSGIIYDVYQWEQKMFDGTKKTFENLKRNPSVMIVGVTVEKDIILLREEQIRIDPYWGVPAGMADDNEGVLEAAEREFLEETGYESNNWNLWFIHQPTSKIHWFEYIFIAKECRRVSSQQLDGGEKTDVHLVSFDEFLNITMKDDFRDYELKLKILEAKVDLKKMQIIKDKLFT